MNLAFRATASAALVYLAVLGCSSASGENAFKGTGAGGAGAASGFGGGAGIALDSGSLLDSSGGFDSCPEELKLVYTIGQNNQFASFNPATLTYTPIGNISCPSAGATPFSMAVQRTGVAWVLFNNGSIFQLDIKTAACKTTPYVAASLGDPFVTFGMGFVSNTPHSTDETLYIASYTGWGVGKIDTTTFTRYPVGQYSGISGAAELTGTGDARLFAFFNNSPIVVAEIDKTNGTALSQAPQPTVQVGSGWAFAFWGGSFWMFTSPTGSSQVDQYDPVSKTTKTVKTGLPTNVVGAGVSTCAPTVPIN